MALTFRTGSDGKGSALTINELDNNFRYFTGSHEISGSLIVSSSLIVSGSMGISGSIIPTEAAATLGSVTNPFKDLFVSPDSIVFTDGTSAVATLNQNNIGNISGSGFAQGIGVDNLNGHFSGIARFIETGSNYNAISTRITSSNAFAISQSGVDGLGNPNVYVSLSGSQRITTFGDAVDLKALEISGSIQVSGSINRINAEGTNGNSGAKSLELTGSLNITGSAGKVLFIQGLPTSDPGVVGQVYNDGGTLKISV